MSFDLVRAAREVISSDTQHPSSNLVLVHYLKDLLSCIDFELVEQTASVGDRVQANIIGLRGPTTAGDGLILSSPLDTVPYLDRETWRTCAGEPLEPVLAGGAIFGLGARSGKVDFLCKLKAASQFQGRSFSRPLYLVGTFGHYQDFLGVRTLLETHLFRAKRVLVGWPTNLELVTMVKSHVVFRFVFSRSDGIPLEGHSVLTHLSTASCAPSEWPALGRDVLREALEAFARAQEIDPDLALVGISSLAPAGLSPGTCRIDAATASGKELGTEWTVTPESAPSFDLSAITPALRALLQVLDENVAQLVPTADHSFRPPQATMSVRQVRTTDDGVSLTMLGRFLPEHDVSALIEHLQAGVEQLSTAFAGLSVGMRVELAIPPVMHLSSSTFVSDALDAISAVGLVAVESALNQGSEAALFESHGYEALVFGPGWPTWTDVSDEEFITLDHLEKATAFYSEMIRRYCCD